VIKIKRYYRKVINYRKVIKRLECIFGYKWGIILNALTITIFMQLMFKIILSLFKIKIGLYAFMTFIILGLPVCLYYEVYHKIRKIMIKGCLLSFSEPFYEHPGVDYDFYDEISEYQILENQKEAEQWNKWYYKINEQIFISLIQFRLLFNCEPILMTLLKVIILQFFLLDYNLTLAYLFSFIFIFSRLLFLLTDKENQKVINPLKKGGMLEKEEEEIKPNRKNAKIMSYWVLRILTHQEVHFHLEEPENEELLDHSFFYIVKF